MSRIYKMSNTFPFSKYIKLVTQMCKYLFGTNTMFLLFHIDDGKFTFVWITLNVASNNNNSIKIFLRHYMQISGEQNRTRVLLSCSLSLHLPLPPASQLRLPDFCPL